MGNMALGEAVFRFAEEAVDVMEDCGEVQLVVLRGGNKSSEVSVDYKSYDISATGGRDYEAVDATLDFKPGQTEGIIKIKVIDDDRYEKAERFRVELSNPSDGAKLDDDGTQAMITILNDDQLKEQASKVLQKLGNRDKFLAVKEAWIEQFMDAIKPSTEGEAASKGELVIHIISVFWKVLFAIVPPTNLGGGWAAFMVSLGFIALMTILVGDLAGLFGCVIGCPPAVTAITFVALGTSMPDMFASKTAAQADESADNSVGNVTGSNCVNVFLGLGLPWLMGAIYWSAGASDKAKLEWENMYTNPASKFCSKNVQDHVKNGGEAAFVVVAGDLDLSVIVFCICAIVCIATMYVRRKVYGGELGGPYAPRMGTAIFFVTLWGIYVLVSALKSTGQLEFGESSKCTKTLDEVMG